jgi:Domain of unknown function (DUF4386)
MKNTGKSPAINVTEVTAFAGGKLMGPPDVDLSVAGLWHLLLCVIDPLRLMYIPSKLFVPGNAAATANNIAAHQRLFRFGIVGDLLGAVILIFLVMAFYRLFKGVDQNLAVAGGDFLGA